MPRPYSLMITTQPVGFPLTPDRPHPIIDPPIGRGTAFGRKSLHPPTPAHPNAVPLTLGETFPVLRAIGFIRSLSIVDSPMGRGGFDRSSLDFSKIHGKTRPYLSVDSSIPDRPNAAPLTSGETFPIPNAIAPISSETIPVSNAIAPISSETIPVSNVIVPV